MWVMSSLWSIVPFVANSSAFWLPSLSSGLHLWFLLVLVSCVCFDPPDAMEFVRQFDNVCPNVPVLPLVLGVRIYQNAAGRIHSVLTVRYHVDYLCCRM